MLICLPAAAWAQAGYLGVLPDIDAEFAGMRKSEKAAAPFSIEELDRQNEQKLKSAPFDNENYIDIIIKRGKPEKYIDDINDTAAVLEKLRRCINTSCDIQMFNAAASSLIDNVEYIRTEYMDKPESSSQSYNKLLLISMHTRETASFWTRGLAVIKYRPYSSKDNIYTKENLNSRLEKLLEEINETIFILKNQK